MNGLVLSVFPGIGLLDLAFELEDFCVVRGPDLLWGGDIARFRPPTGRFEGVIGGPPCQGFTPLRNLGSYGEDLIPEFERVVHEAQPNWWLMENVTQAPVPEVNAYVTRPRVVNNRCFGEAQNRVRRFSFGTREGRELHPVFVALEAAHRKAAVTASHGGG